MGCRNTSHIILGVLAATIFAAINLYVLTVGHPHEDAYILFIYSEMLAHFGEITYFKGGPPTEGATDFLWMAILAALNFIGVKTGLAALVVNAIGVFICVGLIGKAVQNRGGHLAIAIIFALVFPIHFIAQASYAGFSTAIYAAIILAINYVILFAKSGASAEDGSAHGWNDLFWIPILGLLIGLFRPDGVILGVIATFAAMALIDRDYFKRYFLICGAMALLGIGYFVWRWDYFGHILPLPLYVKSQADAFLPGIEHNMDWFAGYIILTGVFIALYVRQPQLRSRLILALLPALSLFVALFFAVQSQNIADRFQAPLAIFLIFAAAIFAADCFPAKKKPRSRGRNIAFVGVAIFLVVIHVGYFARKTDKLIGNLLNTQYINYLPYHLADALTQDNKIILTEAGRFAYWVPGEKYDLVGLNTDYTALNGPSQAYIERLDADIIFIHLAGLINHDCGDVNFCTVSRATLSEKIVAAQVLDTKYQDRVGQSAAAALSFLQSSSIDYEFIFVRYGAFDHFYALKRDNPALLSSFYTALNLSFEPKGRLSYIEMTAPR